MDFVFVENASIGGENARKLIRSHCMRGKNAGKTKTPRTPTKSKDALKVQTKKSITDGFVNPIYRSELDGRFATVRFPCEPDQRMHSLIYRFMLEAGKVVYPEEYCVPTPIRDHLWMSLLTSDDAFFHCVLAMSTGLDTMMRGRVPENPQEMIKHLGNTYRCLNRNLQTSNKPSDSTVATVMSLAIHEDLLGQRNTNESHIVALWRMVDIRGGVGEFEGTQLLLHKICRADIGHALKKGCRPHFFRDAFPHEWVDAVTRQYGLESDIQAVVDETLGIHQGLRSIFRDIESISQILARSPVKLDPYAFQEVLISICYRLLHLYPLSESGPEHEVDRLCYLGLLAFMSSMLFQPAKRDWLPYELLAEKLRSSLLIISSPAVLTDSMRLWILYAGGVSVFRESDMNWYVPWMKKTTSSMGITDWPGTSSQLSKYPWIHAFHDSLGRKVWDRMNST